MEERRKSRQVQTTKLRSFDDLVDEGGNLKPEVNHAATSATEPRPEQSGLRNRNETQESAFPAPSPDQFAGRGTPGDDFTDTTLVRTSTQRSRSSSTATLPASPAPPPVPPKEPLNSPSPRITPQSYQHHPLIDTDDVSNHPSEALVDLTPTTSASSAADLSELNQESYPSNHSQSNFWSVHEWAENNSARAEFYTPPRSEAALGEQDEHIEERSSDEDGRSETGTGESISRIGSISDMDVMSEVSGIDTPGSWSEVGSRISEDY